MKTLVFLAILLLCVVSCQAMPINTEIKDTVSFIFVKGPDSSLAPNGTGFFVGVKDSSVKERYHIYFVTAKHVIMNQDQSQLLPEIYIRMNQIGTGSVITQIPLQGPRAPKLCFHPDSSVDIAVLAIAPDFQKIQVKYIPDEMITTKERFQSQKIREGDEVFFVGLFTPYFGSDRNFPITRFGRVALLPQEKIEWDKTKKEMCELYLIESQSYGGNSGSPVFFSFEPTREAGVISFGGPQVFLAGIMKGNFNQGTPIGVINNSPVPISYQNIGIAAVVPAFLLHEILYSDELREYRGEKKSQTEND